MSFVRTNTDTIVDVDFVVNSLIPSANLILDPALKPPGDLQAKLLRQIVLSGLGDHVAR